tara:strand:- start:1405 stop:2181 length:777 start_codon:yes stop_codon:yes gene_type:complete
MANNIKFGPAGLGPVKTAIETLEEYAKLGFKACEIAFTYGPYIKNKEDAERIGKRAAELGISLSIHGQYWINLNSAEKEKIEKSKERLLKCLEVGTWLGAKRVVFHPGFYGKMSREETYNNIKDAMIDLEKMRKEKKYTTLLAPETMGKVNVFGSVEEIAQLVTDTQCSYCIDFAHILAREKSVDYEKVKRLFPGEEWHVHFSGIIYGEKGEKKHKKTETKEWKNLLENLPKDKEIIIVNESPSMIEDSIEGLKIDSK